MSSGGDNVAPWTVQRETASLIASGAQQRSKRALCMVRWPGLAAASLSGNVARSRRRSGARVSLYPG